MRYGAASVSLSVPGLTGSVDPLKKQPSAHFNTVSVLIYIEVKLHEFVFWGVFVINNICKHVLCGSGGGWWRLQLFAGYFPPRGCEDLAAGGTTEQPGFGAGDFHRFCLRDCEQ